MGLLCEEAGNYLDNVKYCGYCQYHFSKLVSMHLNTLLGWGKENVNWTGAINPLTMDKVVSSHVVTALAAGYVISRHGVLYGQQPKALGLRISKYPSI